MTTNNPFKRATRSQSKLRMAIMGASGSGKSYTALKIASGLGSKIAAIDTERGSLSKYAGLGVEFDVLELIDYNPRNYIAAIQAAVANGYEVLVIDSLSHAWSGTGGILETVDKVAKRSQSNNSFAAWRDVTPLHNQLVDTILGASIHIIVTMRSKTEYVMEKNERTGKTEPRKVGLAPVQRDGMEYEFDVCAEMDTDHNFTITKTRCIDLDNAVITKPDAQLGETLKAWLSDGATPTPAPQPVETVDNTPKASEPEPEQPADLTEVFPRDGEQPDDPVPTNLGELKKLVIQDLKLVKGGEKHWTNLLTVMRESGELTPEMELNGDYGAWFKAILKHYENEQEIA